MKTALYLTILLSIFYSCDNSDSGLDLSNPKIKNAIENRKNEFIDENLKNCKADILDKAGIYVDSVIAAEIDFRINDSIIFPEKPLKPEWPGDIFVSDTISAKPIFKVK